MSLTVFSARSIANDLESAVGEEAFYFYMREIVEQRLFEEYVDDVNGEVKRFAGLVDFMTHKEGLGIRNLSLFEKCLDVVAKSDHAMSSNALWFENQINMAKQNSFQKKEESTGRFLCKPARDIITDGRGASRSYLLRRIARDQPDLLNEIGHGKRFKSARAAAIEAGIITPFPSLQLKEPAPTAQKLLDKKGQAWCLQLLEELSELCL
jgi:hypothetical protein